MLSSLLLNLLLPLLKCAIFILVNFMLPVKMCKDLLLLNLEDDGKIAGLCYCDENYV